MRADNRSYTSAVTTAGQAFLAPVVAGMRRVFCCHKATLSGVLAPNTLAAVRECVEARAQRIEIDVQFLADATPVVFHDDRFDREMDGGGNVATTDPSTARGLSYRASGAPLAFLSDVVDTVCGSETVLQVDLKPFRPLSHARVRSLERTLAPARGLVLLGSQAHWNLRPFASCGFRLAFDPTLHWRHGDAAFRPGGRPGALGRHGLWDDSPLAHEPGVPMGYYIDSRLTDLVSLLPTVTEWMVDISTVRYLWGRGSALGDLLGRRGIALAAWTVAEDRGEATSTALEELFAAGVETVITDVPLQLARRYAGRPPRAREAGGPGHGVDRSQP